MIKIIRHLCQKAGCEPKDLVVEWTPTRGVRLIGTNPQGVKTYLNVLARPDHLAQAIYLCANAQEHLYPRVQQQQAAIDAQLKAWTVKNNDQSENDWCLAQDEGVPEGENEIQKDWRELDTVLGIIRAFPKRPSTDDILDLYQRNKDLKSADLMILLDKLTR